MKILLTGSNGFLGANLTDYILGNHPDYDLTCMIHTRSDRIPSGIRTLKHNLNEPLDFSEYFDIVIHAAGCPSSRECIESPGLGVDNIIQTYNIIEFCRKNKVPKFVFFSSCEVYGSSARTCTEDDVLNSTNMYGASKVAGEHMCSAYSHTCGLRCIALRVMNSWGPYCQKDRFYTFVIDSFKMNTRPHFVLHTKGRKRWINVGEVCKKAFRIIELDLPAFSVFNIVGRENLTLEEFISKFGSDYTVEYKCPSFENGYEPGLNADGSKLDKVLALAE